jgi:DNA-binding LytR/AlgR family response regulator
VRVLIVDDEPAARSRLAAMLADLDVEVAGEAANGVEALELARERRPDLLLLDVAMPEVDGFDVARHLPEPRPLIVFQTAYDEHALRAFEHEAIDYVVKPVTRERLERALDRARRRLAERRAPDLPNEVPDLPPDLLARLAGALEVSAAARPRILVREGRGHRLLPFRAILRFEAGDGLVVAHTKAGRALTDYTLQEVAARAGARFVRTSRADLVNVEAIERIATNGDGSAMLTLADGSTVRVSRRRAAEVRERLEE